MPNTESKSINAPSVSLHLVLGSESAHFGNCLPNSHLAWCSDSPIRSPPSLGSCYLLALSSCPSVCLRPQQHQPVLEMCAWGRSSASAWMFPGLSHLSSIPQTWHRGPLPWEDGPAPTLPCVTTSAHSEACTVCCHVPTAASVAPEGRGESHLHRLQAEQAPNTDLLTWMKSSGHNSNPTRSSRHVEDAVSGISGGSGGPTDSMILKGGS